MGCCLPTCERSYHLPCAVRAGAHFDAQRHWELQGGLFCPAHVHHATAHSAIPPGGGKSTTTGGGTSATTAAPWVQALEGLLAAADADPSLERPYLRGDKAKVNASLTANDMTRLQVRAGALAASVASAQ